jgi:hypothetical protein
VVGVRTLWRRRADRALRWFRARLALACMVTALWVAIAFAVGYGRRALGFAALAGWLMAALIAVDVDRLNRIVLSLRRRHRLLARSLREAWRVGPEPWSGQAIPGAAPGRHGGGDGEAAQANVGTGARVRGKGLGRPSDPHLRHPSHVPGPVPFVFPPNPWAET